VLLTGASGSGKSTLLRALGGLLHPESGESTGVLTVDGEPASSRRSHAGVVFQDPDSQLVMTRAGDDVAFGLENIGVPADRIWAEVDRALDAVGFPFGRDRATGALSGGQKQRLVLAGALAARPGLLLLDEPTAQLDPDGARLVRGAVTRALSDRRATLVVVDHDLEAWLPLVDRVVELLPDGGAVEHLAGW
jgi:energy-coupling factor transport system ATP-binding protein